MVIKVPDLDNKSEGELRQLIHNYEKAGRGGEDIPQNARARLQMISGGGLDFVKSKAAIIQAPQEHRFMSYAELAERNDVKWNQAYRLIGPLLGSIVVYGHHKNWPMVSAIVVNKDNLATGLMDTSALAGFIKAARNLGYLFGYDEVGFLRQQQSKVFEWAKEQP